MTTTTRRMEEEQVKPIVATTATWKMAVSSSDNSLSAAVVANSLPAPGKTRARTASTLAAPPRRERPATAVQRAKQYKRRQSAPEGTAAAATSKRRRRKSELDNSVSSNDDNDEESDGEGVATVQIMQMKVSSSSSAFASTGNGDGDLDQPRALAGLSVGVGNSVDWASTMPFGSPDWRAPPEFLSPGSFASSMSAPKFPKVESAGSLFSPILRQPRSPGGAAASGGARGNGAVPGFFLNTPVRSSSRRQSEPVHSSVSVLDTPPQGAHFADHNAAFMSPTANESPAASSFFADSAAQQPAIEDYLARLPSVSPRRPVAPNSGVGGAAFPMSPRIGGARRALVAGTPPPQRQRTPGSSAAAFGQLFAGAVAAPPIAPVSQPPLASPMVGEMLRLTPSSSARLARAYEKENDARRTLLPSSATRTPIKGSNEHAQRLTRNAQENPLFASAQSLLESPPEQVESGAASNAPTTATTTTQ
jgi:hypothetical protein